MKVTTAEMSLGVEYGPKLTRTAPVVVEVVVVAVGRRSLGLEQVWPFR